MGHFPILPQKGITRISEELSRTYTHLYEFSSKEKNMRSTNMSQLIPFPHCVLQVERNKTQA